MIILASDHAGYFLKEKLKKFLTKLGEEFIDVGANLIDKEDDYPDYAVKACELVVKDNKNKGILICGSGIGMNITANKVKGIRASVIYSKKMAQLAIRHNNVNVITLGGRFTPYYVAKRILQAFLDESFEEGRHVKRIEKISKLEC